VNQQSGERLPLRQLIPAVYGPCLLYETGIGALLPVIPLWASRLGGSTTVAALVAAVLGVGRLIGDVPAGRLAARFGDRRAMLVAATGSIMVVLGCALAENWWLLALGVLLLGGFDAVFLLARQSYLAEHTPVSRRATAMSTLGGVGRIGQLVGPFAGSAVIHLWGLRAVFVMVAVIAVAVGAVVLAVPDLGGERAAGAVEQPVSLVSLLAARPGLLRTLGLVVLVIGAVRAVRNTALPLWGEHLGLSDARIALIFGLSGLADALLFYPGGRIMDRHGRSWVAVPSMLIMGTCLIVLPLTNAIGVFTVVALVIGLGNGLGSGIVMTLGADLAPPGQRAQFLGWWRLLFDSGMAIGPLAISATAAIGSLSIGLTGIGVLGLAAAAGAFAWLPRWTSHANRHRRHN
jgi:MFS family permease